MKIMELETVQSEALAPRPKPLPQFNERELGWGQRFEATDLFRLSPYFTLERAWHFIAFSMLTVGLLIYRHPINQALGVPEWIDHIEFLIVRIKLFMTACALAYWELYRRFFKVEINGFRLVVTTGVFSQETVTAHILPHTTFYVERHSWWEYLTGTATLKIVPASAKKPVEIEFLPVDKAHQARSYLSAQADKQIYVNMEQ